MNNPNKKAAIWHGVTAFCSALVFAFFALPYYSAKIAFIKVSENGYEFLSYLGAKNTSAWYSIGSMFALMTLILAGLMFLASIAAILCDLKIIKSEMLEKFTKWATFRGSFAFVTMTVFNVAGTIVFAIKELGAVKYAGWAYLILILIMGIGAAASSAIANYIKAEQKKDEKAETAKVEAPKEEPAKEEPTTKGE